MDNNKTLKIHFLGASGTVTGSKYLLEFPDCTVLTDCGLFQGLKKLRELNWQQLPVRASDIDYVLLTHGHLDHTGFLPRLVKMGFKGEIWGTAPTLDIAEIILRDSAKIQEEDAERANRDGFTKHSPAKPLYNTLDVEKTLKLFESKPLDDWIRLGNNIRMRFRYNGHILGATFIELDADENRIVFSGDVGRKDDFLLRDPAKPDRADFLFLESTYGDRIHPHSDNLKKLRQVILDTTEQNGTLIIPSFAVERAQLLMYMIYLLHLEESIPRSLPVILDSPMAISALSVFRKHPGWHKLSDEQCMGMTDRIIAVQSYSETLELIDNPESKIIIAGSGMVGGGRVLSYLEKYIGKEETTILLAGFQAEGTRGRQLLEGADEIKFFGNYHNVKARVDLLEGLSAHADRNGLLDWISDIEAAPSHLFLTHGEPHALDSLRVKLKDEYGWNSDIPELYDIKEI
ncbi:MBL fold metallo-hydrolase RNA specificity domain-containing protein [Rhodohalobacter mucosus]|uniref:MBL fold metallo-hydrolase n=1 Tax=Rhodohalobacter mucosus TaxID=2079485 RepID=A0A316TS84_9BACT|nr:MBL fold metallo-hydrolase [Rhodohalobacter mucosus]PWN05875.1 MBL fold metallo-hydrolase [Rhodohalobacter mucosus]